MTPWRTHFVYSKDAANTNDDDQRGWGRALSKTLCEARKRLVSEYNIDLVEHEIDDNSQIPAALKQVRKGDLLVVRLHGYVDDDGHWRWTHSAPEPGIPVTDLVEPIPCGAAVLSPCTSPGVDVSCGPDVMVPKLAAAIGGTSVVALPVGPSRTEDDTLHRALARRIAAARHDDVAAAIGQVLDYYRPRDLPWGPKRENWHRLRIVDGEPHPDDLQAICDHWAKLCVPALRRNADAGSDPSLRCAASSSADAGQLPRGACRRSAWPAAWRAHCV